MPRTDLTPIVVAGPYDTTPITAITWTPADVANGNQFPLTGDQVLLVRNVGAGAHNLTVSSVADPYGRTTTALTSISIPAGAFRVLPRFLISGWKQSDGKLYVSGDHLELEFAVLDLTNNRGGGVN